MMPLTEAICSSRRHSKYNVHSVSLSGVYLGSFRCSSVSEERTRAISARRAAPSGTGGIETPPALSLHAPGTRMSGGAGYSAS